MRIFYLITILLFVGASCSKSKKEPQTETFEMDVLEYKTNVPIPSVEIDFYKCSNYDNVFGCRSKQLFSKKITDNNGKYFFTNGELNSANEGIILRKLNYWETGGGQGIVHMSPEGYIDLHLVKQNIYPDTSLFRISISGESGFGNQLVFSCPVDSIATVRGFGNEINTLNWQVIVKDKNCYQYCIIDTLASGAITQNPAKFGSTSYTLNY